MILIQSENSTIVEVKKLKINENNSIDFNTGSTDLLNKYL